MNENNELSKELIVYNLLTKILKDGAYSNIELDDVLSDIASDNERAYITYFVYGVLDKHIQLEYIINKLVEKPPKFAIKLIIEMGLYMLKYMRTPDYAAINKIVGLANCLGKAGISGFVNGVLRNSVSFSLPTRDIGDTKYLSIMFSYPEWLVGMLIKQYGYDFARDFCSFETDKRTHIRFNGLITTKQDFERKLVGFGIDCSKNNTSLGYYVEHSTMQKLKFDEFTPQALASMIAVQCYAPKNIHEGKALDVCAAPGGKAVYFYELTNLEVTACDIHPHRIDLIKKYADRMKAKLNVELSDALVMKDEWKDSFDVVICDVPCSGTGVINSKPDIKLNRKPEDIAQLNILQYDILKNSAKYVKAGGDLLYSTCSVLKQENEKIIDKFLENNMDFIVERIESPYVKTNDNGYVNLFPQENNTDGFFIAKLRKKVEER